MSSGYQMPVQMLAGGKAPDLPPNSTSFFKNPSEFVPKETAPRAKVVMSEATIKEEEPGMVGFNRYVDGYLMCDNLSVKDIAERATYSPFYLMSKSQLRKNLKAY